MNGRILLLLVSTATVAACARPTPPVAELLTTSVDAPTTTSVAETTTTAPEMTVPTTTTHRHVKTTTKPPPPPPPPPPKPPTRRALPAGDSRLPIEQIGPPYVSADVVQAWKSVCPDGDLCVKITHQLKPPVTRPDDGCVADIQVPKPMYERDTVLYVIRACNEEEPPPSA